MQPTGKPPARNECQCLSLPLMDCRCASCGDVNWGRPDGNEINLETDWLSLNRVLKCLTCDRRGMIDDVTHKELATALGVEVPDSFLLLGYSAQDYLDAVQRNLTLP